MADTLSIETFRDDLAPAFMTINAEWIEAMYSGDRHGKRYARCNVAMAFPL